MTPKFYTCFDGPLKGFSVYTYGASFKQGDHITVTRESDIWYKQAGVWHRRSSTFTYTLVSQMLCHVPAVPV